MDGWSFENQGTLFYEYQPGEIQPRQWKRWLQHKYRDDQGEHIVGSLVEPLKNYEIDSGWYPNLLDRE